jgi:hypothetical protein
MPRVLTRLRIDEVSAVDRGAGDGVKIMLMKREAERAERWKRQEREWLAEHARYNKFAKILGVDKARGDPNYRSVATGVIYPKTFLDFLDEIDEEDEENDARERDNDDDDTAKHKAVEHHQPAKELPMEEDRQTKLRKIAQEVGVIKIAQDIADRGNSFGISELELTQLATEHAQRIYPNDRPDSAFSKLFSGNDADGVTLRRAIGVAKAAPFVTAPTVVGGERARGGDVDADNPEAAMRAYDELLAKAVAYRKANLALSEAQAFSAVFTSKENAELAARAHRRPTARTSFAFPR